MTNQATPMPAKRPTAAPRMRMQIIRTQKDHDRLSAVAIAAAIMLNFGLSVINAHGIGMNNTLVIVIQVAVTAAAAGLVYLHPPKINLRFTISIFLLIIFYLMTSLFQGFDTKAAYDILVIPIFILLGASMSRFPIKALNIILLISVAFAVLEIIFPSAYISIVNPLKFLANTRTWVANSAASGDVNAGLYVGAVRAGGSQFSVADHRVGSIFLEPISLGYFGLICSFIYNEMYRNYPIKRLISVAGCLFLALAADSRIPTSLIVLSTMASLVVKRPYPFSIILAPMLVFLTALILYMSDSAILYGDMGYRLAITFDGLAQTDVASMLVGGVPVDRVGDSGALYIIRNLGLIGLPFSIMLYSGYFSRHPKSPTFVSSCIATYLMVGTLFGGAVFSIKTAALLGAAIGYCGARPLTLPKAHRA